VSQGCLNQLRELLQVRTIFRCMSCENRAQKARMLKLMFGGLVAVLAFGIRVSFASECVISGPRYQLQSDNVEWRMQIHTGQSCVRGIRFNDVAFGTINLVSSPKFGQVTLLGSGFSYKTKSDFQGEDSFVIRVSGAVKKVSGTSTIHIVVTIVGKRQETAGAYADEVKKASGWPDAKSTGVPAGVTLGPSADLTILTPGAVIKDLDIRGAVYINAPNVILERCRITNAGFAVVKIAPGITGTTIQDTEINGVGDENEGSNGIWDLGSKSGFRRNRIYNVENGIVPGNGDLIQDNYIYSLRASGSPHYDGIQIDGGLSDIQIRHNTIINDHGQTSTVMIDNYFGPIANIIVDDNILVGGGYTIYVDGQFNTNPISGVLITNNHMGSGYWGITDFNRTAPIYAGNVNDGASLAQTLNHRP
jgi:hypothetical protein